MCMWLCLFQRDAQLFRAMEHAHQADCGFPRGVKKGGRYHRGEQKDSRPKNKKYIYISQLCPPKEYMPKLAKKQNKPSARRKRNRDEEGL